MRNVSPANTDILSLTSRLSLPVHTDIHNTLTTPRTPRSYVSRRYPGPMYVTPTPFTTQLRYHAHMPFVFLSFAVISTPSSKLSAYPNAPPPVIRVAALPRAPCMSHPHRLPPNTAPTSKCLLCVALTPCDRISGYTPRARPRALIGLRLPAVGSLHTCFPGRTYGCP